MDSWIPGLKDGRAAEVREEFPLNGPASERLPVQDDLMPKKMCDWTSYAWDYNITMLRLLKREADMQARSVSEELGS
jgi:hypothetical protein